jgi:UDP-N-acetylmuramoyl-tripeptide--D-alanyl-D-alanine ligase
MGANHIGEIKALAEIAAPDYGLITNIGKAHLEGFGSPEGVIKAKSELYHYIKAHSGNVFVNGNNPLLYGITENLELKRLCYIDGKPLICDGFVNPGSFFLRLKIIFREGAGWEVQTKLTGDYNFENVMAAAAIGKYFNVPESDIISAIESYTPENNRSQFIDTGRNKLIMDAYNANPGSMQGALKNFIGTGTGSKIAILGDMLELGDYETHEHQEIMKILDPHKELKVVLIGPVFTRLANTRDYLTFPDSEKATEHFRRNPVTDHLILLKGSRGIRLEKLLDVF